MFTNYFKMTDHPFPAYLPASSIQKDARFSEALDRLLLFVECEISALITGDEGVGKSSLIRLFIETLEEKRLPHVYLHFTQLQSFAFLKFFVHALDEKPAITKDALLSQIIAKLERRDKNTVCIIDEAHLLDSDTLLDLRLLLSSAVNEQAPFKLLLVGHSQLKNNLRQSCNTALSQRITVRYHLNPYSKQQTINYLDFHLQRVNCTTKLFDQDVKEQIYEQSRGFPRIINNLATAALITAEATNMQKITSECFTQALYEFNNY